MAMDAASHRDFDDHEKVVFLSDPNAGLEGFIAIHATSLGPAAGGCRMAHYGSRAEALSDALRLSRGMSYKNAIAGLPAGGGKAVLYPAGPNADRAALFEAFGAAVDDLAGQYVTAEDCLFEMSDGVAPEADLGPPLVCGGANNQLAGPEDVRRLFARGVTYAPDYVVNAGGIINVMAEFLGESASSVEARVWAIAGRVSGILQQAEAEGLPPYEVADRMARQRLGARPAKSAA
jgi:glutamate dehydrogenase/leucine dehydrogenase